MSPASDAKFSGSVPRDYDAHLVPLLFAPYADDLAGRIQALRPSRLAEP